VPTCTSPIDVLQRPEEVPDVLRAPRLAAGRTRERVERVRDEAEAEQLVERTDFAGPVGLGIRGEKARRAVRLEPGGRFVLADLPRRVRELPRRPVDACVFPVEDAADPAVVPAEISAVDIAVHRAAREPRRRSEPCARPLVRAGEDWRHLDEPHVPPGVRLEVEVRERRTVGTRPLPDAPYPVQTREQPRDLAPLRLVVAIERGSLDEREDGYDDAVRLGK